MDSIKTLSVRCQGRRVGILALYKNWQAAFEYDPEWLNSGFSISPLSLPLEKKVFLPKATPLEGLFGIFADSLPDGWGRLLMDRLLLKNGVNPHEVGSLDRLAIIGSSGMGALTYEPEHPIGSRSGTDMDLDRISLECENVLQMHDSADLDKLFQLGGSSGGARPKILTAIDGEEWIIKFPSSKDSREIGEQEYRFSVCARECGITVSQTKLFPSACCAGYFGTRRFDRAKLPSGGQKRIHMASVGALLETTHRIPNLDYNMLMKLTLKLTKDFGEVEKLFRLMCFNVFAHNRDDHAKNFSFLYDEAEHRWLLSPAYDLTYSSSIGGEHATCINGNGKNPGMADILAVAGNIGLSEGKSKAIALEIQDIVRQFGLNPLRGKERPTG